jgi:expansin (peptidoglycan-binding protein)
LCSSTAAANVVVNALPSLTITADTLICVGNTVTLSAYGAANYTWMPINLTGSTVVDSPTMATTYYLNAVDANGCSGTAIFSVNVDPCAGIIQHGKENVIFYLYPNPASDKLTLRINVSSSFDGVCEIKDISGKIVMKQNLKFVKEKSEYHFNISPFANGIYFFRMSSKDASSGELKVVKE